MAAWTYRQSTGELLDPTGEMVEVGYSGCGVCCNRPVAQSVSDAGPIPRGSYSIGPPRDDEQMGPFALPLEPHPDNEMYGRFGFYCHGDNETHDASTGCVILSRACREEIAASACTTMVVTL